MCYVTANSRLSGYQKEYVIKDLIPGTEYEVEISAFNPAGTSVSRYTFKSPSTTGSEYYILSTT